MSNTASRGPQLPDCQGEGVGQQHDEHEPEDEAQGGEDGEDQDQFRRQRKLVWGPADLGSVRLSSSEDLCDSLKSRKGLQETMNVTRKVREIA